MATRRYTLIYAEPASSQLGLLGIIIHLIRLPRCVLPACEKTADGEMHSRSEHSQCVEAPHTGPARRHESRHAVTVVIRVPLACVMVVAVGAGDSDSSTAVSASTLPFSVPVLPRHIGIISRAYGPQNVLLQKPLASTGATGRLWALLTLRHPPSRLSVYHCTALACRLCPQYFWARTGESQSKQVHANAHIPSSAEPSTSPSEYEKIRMRELPSQVQ